MGPTTRSSKELKETTSTPFGPPFNDADADTILQSSDQVDFYVYRVILSKVSPVFESMFSLPQPDTCVSGKQIPIISLTENSKIIVVLLTSIHPTVAAKFVPSGVMIDSLVAAKKYDMDVVSNYLVEKFAKSKAVQDSPVEAFCLAYSHELGEAARVAAKASLKHRLRLGDIGDKLQHTNGPGLHQLWKFHHACSATAVEAVSDNRILVELSHDNTWRDFKDTVCRHSGSSGPGCREFRYRVGPSHSWEFWDASAPWHDYITRAHNVLLEHPCSEAVSNYSFLKPSYKKAEDLCTPCLRTLYGLSDFSRLLGKEVERRVSEVKHFLTYFLDTSHPMTPPAERSI